MMRLPQMGRTVTGAFTTIISLLLFGALGYAYYWPETTHERKTDWVGEPGPKQPIDFYHHVHVAELHVPCAYCHWTASRSNTANLPPVDVCWGCHKDISITHPEIQLVRSYYLSGKPIPWVRVNHQPGYVYFSHSSHVAAGVACATCHGNVGNMYVVYQPVEMNMGWCVTCHRHNEARFRPKQAAVDCYTCHR